LKVIALREQDLEDLEILLPRMIKKEKEILVEIMNRTNNIRSDSV